MAANALGASLVGPEDDWVGADVMKEDGDESALVLDSGDELVAIYGTHQEVRDAVIRLARFMGVR